MTTETTIAGNQHTTKEDNIEKMREGRQFLKYTFYQLTPQWRATSPEERSIALRELLDIVSRYEQKIIVKTFSLIGTRGD